MKHLFNKRFLPCRAIASILVILMIALSISSCSGGKTETPTEKPSETTEKETEAAPTGDDSPVIDDTIFNGRDDIAYILIYNPDIYNEDSDDNVTVNTGSFGSWIDTSAVRAGEQELDLPYIPVAQNEFSKDLTPDDFDLSGNRASVSQPDFEVGDKHEFYHEAKYFGNEKSTFKCVYSGTHGCFWIPEDETVPDNDMLNRIAKEFDEKIYNADVDTFGTPRYADEGGKIHVVFSEMNLQKCGYFWPLDLFTSEEMDDSYAASKGANRDLAVIHLNLLHLQYKNLETSICSTLAHELQHLINFTAYTDYNKTSWAGTWINEAMSGYIEEKLYPGIKSEDGHYAAFATSNLIRHGQSMYNFGTENTDIGVYGSVFLFSQYLENIAGEDVFKNFHKYWRTTFDENKLYDDCALDAVIPAAEKSKILDEYAFPAGSLSFADSSSELMSKLTLDFYISLLKYDSTDPDAYENVEAQALLYDEINPADIEGGGRVIAATKDGEFQIPDNAEHTLIYIGFDEDFNQITEPVVH